MGNGEGCRGTQRHSAEAQMSGVGGGTLKKLVCFPPVLGSHVLLPSPPSWSFRLEDNIPQPSDMRRSPSSPRAPSCPPEYLVQHLSSSEGPCRAGGVSLGLLSFTVFERHVTLCCVHLQLRGERHPGVVQAALYEHHGPGAPGEENRHELLCPGAAGHLLL